MLTLEVPYVPSSDSITTIQRVDSSSSAGRIEVPALLVKNEILLKDCIDVLMHPNNRSATNSFGILPIVFKHLGRSLELDRNPYKAYPNIKSALIEAPKHGETSISSEAVHTYRYEPEPGYLGPDRMVFLVEAFGKRFRVVFSVLVVDATEHSKWNDEREDGGGRTPQCKSLKMGASGDEVDGISVAIGNLDGMALAQVVGQSIILSPAAAGHGWFIDLTPSQNEEFLPTSNPNEWVAKDGSEAFGKMDLLTVLLHEYGHVLGLDHSQDGQDFMASTLAPGVRRTLSADQQMQLMQLAGYFPVPDSPSSPYGPTDPGAPLPFTRTSLSTRFGRARASALDAARARFTRDGGSNRRFGRAQPTASDIAGA